MNPQHDPFGYQGQTNHNGYQQQMGGVNQPFSQASIEQFAQQYYAQQNNQGLNQGFSPINNNQSYPMMGMNQVNNNMYPGQHMNHHQQYLNSQPFSNQYHANPSFNQNFNQHLYNHPQQIYNQPQNYQNQHQYRDMQYSNLQPPQSYRSNDRLAHVPWRPRDSKANPNARIMCSPCNKSFMQQTQYDEHVSQHIKCAKCDFSAHRAIVARHEEDEHQYSGLKFPRKEESPEEIAKYIAARKKSYPTAENIQQKQKDSLLRFKELAGLSKGKKSKGVDKKRNAEDEDDLEAFIKRIKTKEGEELKAVTAATPFVSADEESEDLNAPRAVMNDIFVSIFERLVPSEHLKFTEDLEDGECSSGSSKSSSDSESDSDSDSSSASDRVKAPVRTAERPVAVNSTPRICRNFQQGSCKFGEKCRFKHEIDPNFAVGERNPERGDNSGERGRGARGRGGARGKGRGGMNGRQEEPRAKRQNLLRMLLDKEIQAEKESLANTNAIEK